MKRKLTFAMLILLVASLLLTGIAAAQSSGYSLGWFTIDGGGGTSAAGGYVLNGTIGQPDAGSLNGGPYSLFSGFWAGFADWLQQIFLPILRK